MSTRTITLTDRAPVKINDDLWPLIASASDSEHDGQVECQANCLSKWFLGVRQHADGRAIVYAIYSYDTSYPNRRNYDAKHGELLPIDTDMSAIVAAINDVTARMAEAECEDDDAKRWTSLANECIADLPAETLD